MLVYVVYQATLQSACVDVGCTKQGAKADLRTPFLSSLSQALDSMQQDEAEGDEEADEDEDETLDEVAVEVESVPEMKDVKPTKTGRRRPRNVGKEGVEIRMAALRKAVGGCVTLDEIAAALDLGVDGEVFNAGARR